MTFNLKASSFIPSDPKLAAVALLAPVVTSIAIRSMQGYDWKIALQHSCLWSALNITYIFASGKLSILDSSRFLNQAVFSAYTCCLYYCLYKAKETKSPYKRG